MKSFQHIFSDSSAVEFRFGKNEAPYHSIFLDEPLQKSSDTIHYINLYKGHELVPGNNEPVMRNSLSPDWFFPLILIVLAIFAWLRMFYSKYFSQMVQALFNMNLINQIVRDENIFVQRASIFMSIAFNIIAALFLYLISMHLNWFPGEMDSGFFRFVFFLIVVSAVYALKFLVLKLCGWLFDHEKEMATYIFNIFLINNILGITLLPFILLLAYNSSIIGGWVFLIPISIAMLAFGMRIFRGVQIGLGMPSFSPLYLFLYLCTLEIAPLIVLIRLVVQ